MLTSQLNPCLQLLTNFFLSVAKAALQPTDEPDKVTHLSQTANLLLCASAWGDESGCSAMLHASCAATWPHVPATMLPAMLSLVIAVLAGQKAQANA